MGTTDSAAEGLRAGAGDRIVIRMHHLGDRVRDGEILEALGEGGRPPFLVRWSEDGRVTRFFPGSDAYIEHFAPKATRRSA